VVSKGALTQEQADAKLAALEAKSGTVDAKKDGLTKAQADAKAKAFKAEQDVNAKRLAAWAEADAIAAAALLLKKLLKSLKLKLQLKSSC
jgi:small subunit ribosomal protein S16